MLRKHALPIPVTIGSGYGDPIDREAAMAAFATSWRRG
jgi:hypothetical protein